MNFEVRPLGEALGAEIIGLDVSRPLDETALSMVRDALLRHLVIVFRDQRLTPAAQVAFASRFGPLDKHPADDATLPDYPHLLVVSTRKENGKFVGLPDAGPMWHSDLAYMQRPALGSMLYAIEVPERGGDTGFANMYAAYEALPADLRSEIEVRKGVFLAGRNNQRRTFTRRYNEAQQARTPAVLHPLVRRHPETGRRSIFANPQHTIAIDGMDEADSSALLARLFEHATQPEFTYFHRWRAGDLTFWDNRCTYHVADLSRVGEPDYIRHMHRTTIQGDVPF